MQRFQSLEELVAELGGKRVLKRVLIANNGIAALKGIRSMRQWAYELLGDENALQFVCMATPEDIKVNVEYIKMADETIEVPGGRNSNNYNNVPLIVDVAIRGNCDAVWAGWGHASENPDLPTRLKEKGITFLGPPAGPMNALGDKIASTIVAQTARVPTIAWSGSGLLCPADSSEVPDDLFQRACIRDAQHCIEVCKNLQFPLMIKASEGGGGKGIRMVSCVEEVENAYHAVAGEVVRSPIFVMKLASDVRHLEVQLLADEDGECISLRTRDCSVQRRHQKIIEEGPVVKTIPGALENMEKAAVRLAKIVGYRSVGTVEYLYHKGTGVFYFLELNPRLQVEHTVTELITGVNLPACMLCVGMGIPLSRIPDIRSYYKAPRFGKDPIDFETAVPALPTLHTIACRITAENPDDGFTPTTGTIDELVFRNSKNAWGYFSISSHGGVHEFADSQFGHIFSTAETRDEAIAGMVLALKQLTIRGEIRTTKEYLLKLLDMPQFKDSDISTAWLDGLIKNRLRVEAPNPFLSVLCAATFKAVERFDANRAKYLSFLEAGHVPSSDLFTTRMPFTLVLDQVKYEVLCTKSSPTEWTLTLNGGHIQVGYRRLADRGLMLALGEGRSPVVYAEEDAACLRVTVDGRTATFTHEVDPTKLRSQMPGKLVRYLVADGDHVDAHTPFCEIEVMKMYLQLKTSIAGTISLKAQPGTTIHAGKVLAIIDPEDPDNIVKAEENKKPWPSISLMWGSTTPPASPKARGTPTSSLMTSAKKALETCYSLINGYDLPKDLFEQNLSTVSDGLMAVGAAEVTLDGIPLSWVTKDLSRDDLVKLDNAAAGKARMVHTAKRLCEIFLDVESLYEGGKLHQEVVDGLRSEREAEGLEEVFDIQLAHAGPHRHRVLVHLLTFIEQAIADDLRGVLQRVASLSSSKSSMVVFTARHLLRKIDLPCPDRRRQDLQVALASAKGNSVTLKGLVDQLGYGTDVISSFLMDNNNEHLPIAVELLLRRVYAGVFEMSNFGIERQGAGRHWVATWGLKAKSNQNPLKHDGITGSTSCEELDELANQAVDECANGIMGIFDSVEDVLQYLGEVISCVHNKNETVCKVVVRQSKKHTHGVLPGRFGHVISEYMRMLQATNISRVTFLAISGNSAPLYYTFRRSLGFSEDTTYRHIAPSLAHMLELQKLRNYNIELYQGNPIHQVHVYTAKEKSGLRPRPVTTKQRLFVRSLVLPSDVSVPASGSAGELSDLSLYDAERAIANCVNALEIATADRNLETSAANHIFIAFEGMKTEYHKVDVVVRRISSVHESSLFRLGVLEVEIKLMCIPPGSDKPVPMRFFISNPTTHKLVIESYIEVEDSQAPGRSVLMHVTADGAAEGEAAELTPSPLGDNSISSVNLNIGKLDVPTPIGRSNSIMWEEGSTGTADSMKSPLTYRLKVRTTSSASQQHGSKKELFWHHQSPLTPYPLLSPYELRRLLALQNGTIYAYDWVSLFEHSVYDMWAKTVQGRPDLMPALEEAMPRDLLIAQELVYTDGTLKSTLRSPGENRVGMVGWKWTLYHPSHYDPATGTAKPRTLYVVANDITVLSGSFSTPEDELYAAIARAARLEGVPLVYLSANSGARIGLDPELKKLFKIKQSEDPSKMFDYLYLDDETKRKLDEKREVCHTTPVTDESGVVHHKLDAIIGAQWGLGVENLSGSGLIAGEMAKCYDSIPTISVASGRTVGIGAYLVRLGRRVVQVKNSPIILTGNNALNKLLGKEVYTSNSQLGGTNIMGPNGVSHWVSMHNFSAVQEVMTWLDFVPDKYKVDEEVLPYPTLKRISAVHDPVDREVKVTTLPNTPYDARMLIEGHYTDNGWVGGLFDKDSFQEAQQDWAKTVVVGRATLGEMPVGVIAVETRAINKFNPADPADPTSVSAMTQQAGMVWYPDSARKTADFLADLHREGLPAVILANWRGFSGGMRDMYDEVLKFGADIVQNLTHYKQPITVYIPPHGELRGGAWVVIDPTINKRSIEMFADTTARGGVLEPSGIIEIKYREKEIQQTMDRLDPECHRLSTQLAASEGQLRQYLERMLRNRHDVLFPTYKAAAVEFADLHDRPGRMLAVKSIDGVLDWTDARKFLYARMSKRVLEFHFDSRLKAAGIEDNASVYSAWFSEYAQGHTLDGIPYESREPTFVPGMEEDLQPQSWLGATDEQKVAFFKSIDGTEVDNAITKLELEAKAEKLAAILQGNSALYAAVQAKLEPDQ